MGGGNLFAELKVITKTNKGEQSTDQVDFQAWVEHFGLEYVLCFSASGIVEELRKRGAIKSWTPIRPYLRQVEGMKA